VSPCDPQRLLRELLCTFAQPRSSPSWAGVSSISRDTCKASAETTTNIRWDAFVVLQPNPHKHVGARAGNRTLNLGIKRRLTLLARKCQGASGRAARIRRSDAFVPQRVLACHRLPWVSCHISCQIRVPRLLTSTCTHRTKLRYGPVRLLLGPHSKPARINDAGVSQRSGTVRECLREGVSEGAEVGAPA
jgi:hypothetical protein